MTDVKFIKVPNRLAKLTRAKGGIAVGEAMKQAEHAIEGLRDASLAVIDDNLAEIYHRYGPGSPKREMETLDGLYGLASRIIDAGGGLPDSGLEEAARAVCELIARSRASDVRDWDAIDVHVATLKVLRTEGQKLSELQRQTILKGLSDVTAKRAGEA